MDYIRVSFGPLVHVSTKLVGLSPIRLLSMYKFVLILFDIDLLNKYIHSNI